MPVNTAHAAGLGLPPSPASVEVFLNGAVDTEPVAGAAPVATLAELFGSLLPRAGAVVVIALPGSTALLRHFFGTLFAGAVPVLAAPTTPASRLGELARRLGATALVVPRGKAVPYTTAARAQLPGADVLVLPGPHRLHRPGQVILLTSGTSGVSSGCLHSASALMRNAAWHAASIGLTSDDTMLVNLPMHFSYALVAQVLAAMSAGARIVVDRPPCSQARYTAMLKEYGVTASSLMPCFVRRLLAGGWSAPRGLRALTVGGDMLEAGAVGALLSRAPGTEIYLTYGLAEAGPRVSTLAAHLEPPHRHTSCGRPLDGVGITLRPRGEDGPAELVVASETVMLSRVGVPEGEANTALITPGRVATGDLFDVDRDGYLYFRSRLTDFLVVNGSRVSLGSVRRLASSLPGVVGARTRPGLEECGEPSYELDLYMHDMSDDAVERATSALLGGLLRTEHPHRIRALPHDSVEALPK
ncbi:class I adenylate-forming enzyme family protein [Sinosporangium siamense]|uniref:Coronafacic acid synthetase n=1 Tax=Sinosporangium siamense TaxID=1367973 RepID=A0A919V792_9ACTN|nr:class I adenylate-forming enzyme family protein [Sinosporangium siamense]GII91847.1 coronafacic acid synthetase [Sinosporangium siamense]